MNCFVACCQFLLYCFVHAFLQPVVFIVDLVACQNDIQDDEDGTNQPPTACF